MCLLQRTLCPLGLFPHASGQVGAQPGLEIVFSLQGLPVAAAEACGIGRPLVQVLAPETQLVAVDAVAERVPARAAVFLVSSHPNNPYSLRRFP